MADATHTHDDPAAVDHAQGDHGHDPHLAHHFDSLEQQYDAGKLGIWAFIAQEVLFFSGLFCAYSALRYNQPEVFEYAHRFLDKFWGAVNTCVLLFSSLTMAWGVRCAQLGHRKGLILNLWITILCGCAFMCVKYIEYKHKIDAGLLWGGYYKPDPEEIKHLLSEHGTGDHNKGELTISRDLAVSTAAQAEDRAPPNTRLFFSVYFCMTGLHGLHVLVGIGLLTWLLMRAYRGDFGPTYFTPVDFIGLYWHVVDLIWIFLFPLLYLIH